ncbi:MAG TPA: inositol monophosphatase, partial [Thermoplasmatales archaeon]|nr:inositol monophosphatase [Thermoplasmatales archaeon]
EYGIVINIPTGETFMAEKGKGAFFNNNRIIAPQHTPRKLIYSVMLEKKVPDTILQGHMRAMGSSSLEMCLVARGSIDCFACLKEYLRVTDIAASTLIVREAGGYVYDMEGKELDMPLDVAERTSVIAAPREDIIFRLLESNP